MRTAELVTGPGVHHGMPNDVYHEHTDWLSSTGAKLLLPPSCPAIFRWTMDNPVQKRAYDIGNAVHDTVLGGGPEIVVVDSDDWRTKAAREERDEIRARNAVPILRDEWVQVRAMADAVLTHPVGGKLLEPGAGEAEVSLFWTDQRAGVQRRARLDYVPNGRLPDGRLLLPDLKTSTTANPAEFAKAAARYGYDLQQTFYTDAVLAQHLAEDVAFLFVVVEKTPPYLVEVVQLSEFDARIGAVRVRAAVDVFAGCTESGQWPGYTDNQISQINLPVWHTREYEDQL